MSDESVEAMKCSMILDVGPDSDRICDKPAVRRISGSPNEGVCADCAASMLRGLDFTQEELDKQYPLLEECPSDATTRKAKLDELVALSEEFGLYEQEESMTDKKLHCDMQGVGLPCPSTDNEFYSVASVQRPLCQKHAAELAGRGISVFRIEDGETVTTVADTDTPGDAQ